MASKGLTSAFECVTMYDSTQSTQKENRKMPTKARSFRMSDEAYKQLEELAALCNMSTAQWLVTMISSEYDRITGSPKAKRALKLMGQMKQAIADLMSEDDMSQTVINIDDIITDGDD